MTTTETDQRPDKDFVAMMSDRETDLQVQSDVYLRCEVLSNIKVQTGDCRP